MQRWPLYFLFVISVLMLLFTLSRVAFYFLFVQSDVPGQAFRTGFDFDLMAASYLCVIPFLVFSVSLFTPEPAGRFLRTLTHWITATALVCALLLLFADLPYFSFFHSRITTSVLMWIEDPEQSFRFVFSEKKLFPFIILFVVISALLIFMLTRVKKRFFVFDIKPSVTVNLLWVVLMSAVLFYGMRGSRLKRPPGMKDAFFSNNSVINQMSLNPLFTWYDSFSFFKINFFEKDADAAEYACRQLNISPESEGYPLSRTESHPPARKKYNVVLILMEGMSMEMTGQVAHGRKLTPFLDSLAFHHFSFSRCFSAGIHTCNGVFAALYGMPALMSKHPFSHISSQSLHFYGAPQVFRENGYTNLFFLAHHEEFDNNGYFLPRNGIDRIFSLKDYDASMIENVWGVSDEYLFDFALKQLDSLHHLKSPFFATLLTISTHPPQSLPRKTAFKPQSQNLLNTVFEYADYALQRFFIQARRKDWFQHTIFVLNGDHGINLPSPFEAPLSHNHVPLVLITPDSLLPNLRVDHPVMQTDIFPMLMQLCGISFVNNTLGVNPFRHKRPFIFFSQDNRLCILDKKHLLVINKYGNEIMYELKTGQILTSETENMKLIPAMKSYAYSMLQTLQLMIVERKTGRPE